jgi:hypothetical protein
LIPVNADWWGSVSVNWRCAGVNPKKRVMAVNENFGLCPFWFWNGEMADAAIHDQVRLMREAGIGGLMIQARQGLTIPYLSRKWFDKVAVAVAAAKEYGLDVWICDEYPYPSGNAGGEVLLEHPEYAAAQLQVFRQDLGGPREFTMDLPWGEPVWAAAYPVCRGVVDWEHYLDLKPEIGIISPERIFQLNGLTRLNQKRFFSGRPQKQLCWEVPGGDWRVYLFIQVPLEHQKFFGRFIDPLNPDAVECFMRVTHEKYRECLGAEFGKTIKGFFVDEIEPQPHEGELRWSPLLPELFLERKGYPLPPKLPALLEPCGEDTAKIRYDYWDVLTRAFIDSFEKPVAEWCHANGLWYAGEKPILRSSQLQYFDVPGIDVGHQKVNSVPVIAAAKYRANAKLLSSAAHFYGKSRALCECFHSVGWGMTLRDMRWMIDWIAIQGVNFFVPHAFFYTTQGLTRHDAPPSSFHQNPAWRHTALLSRHVNALCEIGTDFRREVNILVMDPVTSRWTAMGEKRRVGPRLAEDFSRLQRTLLRHHFDFYIIDPQKLAESRVAQGRFHLGGESFAILILPPLQNLECAAWERVKEFVADGGRLIGTGCLPVETIDGAADLTSCCSEWFGCDALEIYQNYCAPDREETKPGRVFRNRGVFVEDIRDLPEVLGEYEQRKIGVTTGAGRENESFLVNHYSKRDRVFIFALNTTGTGQPAEIRWAGPGARPHVAEILAETAGPERRAVNSWVSSGSLVFRVEFAPYQSRLFEVSPDGETFSGSCWPPENFEHVIWLDPKQQWDLKIPWNVLRLDDWQLGIAAAGSEPAPDEARIVKRVKCRPIINQLAESGLQLPVRLANHFGCPPEMILPALECRYRTEWRVETSPSDMWLVMEAGALCGEWGVVLNGHPIAAESFRLKPFFDPADRAVSLLPYLRTGWNDLEVKVKTAGPADGLVNPLYICGDFGVFRTPDQKGWNLAALPARGRLHRPGRSGLPFYAGQVVYSRWMQLDMTRQPLQIGIPDLEDPVELAVNGHKVGVRAWDPFVWEIPPQWVRPGENFIEVTVSTTLLGLYEGCYYDPEHQRYQEY